MVVETREPNWMAEQVLEDQLHKQNIMPGTKVRFVREDTGEEVTGIYERMDLTNVRFVIKELPKEKPKTDDYGLKIKQPTNEIAFDCGIVRQLKRVEEE